MAFIQPNSTIWLCKGIPLDNTYKNTLTFSSRDEQASYFINASDRVLEKYSVIRNGVLRVEGNIGDYYNYNYMAFRNTNFSNKMFYAFITGVDYINPNTTNIKFQLDVMQSWIFDWTFKDCLIEREHVENDTKYAYLEPENISVGEIIDGKKYGMSQQLENHLVFCIGLTEEMPAEITSTTEWQEGISSDFIKALEPAVIQGVFKAEYTYSFKIGSVGLYNPMKLIAQITDYFARSGLLDQITEIYLYFDNFLQTSSLPSDITAHIPMSTTIYDGNNSYTPVNNKVLQYPYCYMEVNGYSQTQELKYELFEPSSQGTTFIINCLPYAGTSVSAYPLDYAGRQANYDAICSGCPMPVFPYTKDVYLNEYQANRNSRVANINAQATSLAYTLAGQVKNFVGSVGSLATGLSMPSPQITTPIVSGANVGNLLQSGAYIGGQAANFGNSSLGFMQSLSNIKNAINIFQADQTDTLRRPPNIQNLGQQMNLMNALGLYVPFVVQKNITIEFAKKIDKYFSMFGYKVNRTGIPNINTRPKYNFLKLAYANIVGNMNQEDISSIITILENGITFWHDPSIVGNYDVNNK